MSEKLDLFIKYGLLAGMFVFLVLGVVALGQDPDFIFDRFFSAGIFLFFFFMYKRMNLTWPILLIGLFGLTLHHLKLYGNVYFGFEFDMIMHFVIPFALALILYQYMSKCEGISCTSKTKLVILTVLAVAGLGTLLEITEYFGYAKLPAGEGILHYGLGDAGDWADAVTDMMFNLFGAITGAFTMVVAHYRKRAKIRNLKLFLTT